TDLLFFQPIYDLISDRIVSGRVALVGDAAFVARPHCGMGVTKAACDAMALVKALGSHADMAQALAAYQDERISFGQAIVKHARNMGMPLHPDLETDEDRAMADRYRDPDTVMRET